MTDKTSTARIQTSFDTTGKTIGRSAVEWRHDYLCGWANQIAEQQGLKYTGPHDGIPPIDEQVENAKWVKPRFEVHERPTAHREYRAVLMERKKNGQLIEIAAVRIGMFGKLLKEAA